MKYKYTKQYQKTGITIQEIESLGACKDQLHHLSYLASKRSVLYKTAMKIEELIYFAKILGALHWLTNNNIIQPEEPEITYHVGQHFSYNNTTYILAQTDRNKVSLIDIITGGSWKYPTHVNDGGNITEHEFSLICNQTSIGFAEIPRPF